MPTMPASAAAPAAATTVAGRLKRDRRASRRVFLDFLRLAALVDRPATFAVLRAFLAFLPSFVICDPSSASVRRRIDADRRDRLARGCE
jgi:hypothetical protein